MFREPEETKVFEMDSLASAPTKADELNMDLQKGSSTKYTSWPLSSANHPFSVAAPKPLSSNMNSRSVLPTKTISFA